MRQLDKDSSIVLLSGGMDSTTVLYHAIADGRDPKLALSFYYGQRHANELQYARKIAAGVEVRHSIISLSDITEFLKGSALTDDVDVPHGHYAEDNMRMTIVPNRNSMMLNIAAAIAIGMGIRFVYAAMHAGDHPVYPDCRPEFIRSLTETLRIATETDVEVLTPFIFSTKAEIVRRGYELCVPFERTWSCYQGGNVHCGRCGTCVERAEAFALAGVEDPTLYDDPNFWKEAVQKAAQ